MKTVKVEETQYVRDVNSKAILNTNRNALENYKLAKKRKEQEISDINSMKQDILELKELVKKLIEK
mgnify:FL=1|jgi:hypothetical protein